MSSQTGVLNSSLIGNIGVVETLAVPQESSRDILLDDAIANLASIIGNENLSNSEIQQSVVESLSALPYTYYFEVLTKLSEWIEAQEMKLNLNESDARVLARSELIQNLKILVNLGLVSQAKDMQLQDLYTAYNALTAMQNAPTLNPKVKEFLLMLSIAVIVLLGLVGYAGYRSELDEERKETMGLSVEDIQDESDLLESVEL
jgi:hypothetical protein